jgi:O-Antigen ligase
VERLGGPAAGGAAFALTVGLASDEGGFAALAWDRALVGLGALALVLAIVVRVERPGRHAAVLLAGLGLLAAWAAASWLWSESPPRALVEAQRGALYLAAAAAVVVAGRRVAPVWIAGGVAAGATAIACWNLALRARGVHGAELGAGADPVGYANGLALLCVVGLLLLPLLPRLALLAAAPLAVDLAVQHSTGALAALAAGALVHAAIVRPRLRVAACVLALAGVASAPFALGGHYRADYWRVAVREAHSSPVLGSGAGTFSNWWVKERPVPQSTLEAHSLYLETLAELGPIGLALLLAGLTAPLAAAVRGRQPALAGALAAYDVAAAVDFHWELAGVTAPVVLLAAVACAHASSGSRAVPRAFLVPALAAFTAASLLAYAGTARLTAAQDALRSGDPARAAADARSALHFAPFSADAWRAIGDAESSAAAYRRALALDERDWSLWLRLAAVTRGAPHRLALREAMRLNPLLSER